jgi:hypothetical protein
VSISRRSVVGLVAALVLWTALALFWLIATPGEAHVCGIVGVQTTDANGQTLTQAEMDRLVSERCDRGPSLGVILLFGNGYVVIVGLFAVWADRRSERSSDEPLGPSG